MQFKFFAKSWDAMRTELAFYRIVIVALLLALVVTLFGWLRKENATTLVPPTVTEAMEVSRNKASGSYKKSWGLFTATMLGNLTPGNADFVLKSLEELFAPETYGDLKRRLASDLDTLKKEQVTVSFEPQLVTYEPATDKVFVAGRSTLEGTGGKADRFGRSYEFCVRQQNGKPSIHRFRTYLGEPRVMAYWVGRGKSNDEDAAPCGVQRVANETASDGSSTTEVKPQ